MIKQLKDQLSENPNKLLSKRRDRILNFQLLNTPQNISSNQSPINRH